MNNRRAENAFLTVLIMLAIVSIEKAFIHSAGLLILFLVPLIVAAMIQLNKNGDRESKT